MNKPVPAPEPSMEDILASIRRIISDGDEAEPGRTGAVPGADRNAGGASETERNPAVISDEPAGSAAQWTVPAAEPAAPAAAGPSPVSSPSGATPSIAAPTVSAPVFNAPAFDPLCGERPVAPAANRIAEPVIPVRDPVEDAATGQDSGQVIGPEVTDPVSPERSAAPVPPSQDRPAGSAAAGTGAASEPGAVPGPAHPGTVRPETAQPARTGDVPENPAETGPASPPVDPDTSAAGSDAQAVRQPGAPDQAGDTTVSGLLSPESDAAVASAFGRLANTMLSQDPRTLEDLVGEMLKPMLRDWLDDNLPVLVERLVREEIERVSRGRR